MARKPEADKNKREAILQAATDCFFEKGYDAVSVREIMRRAGAEVGLFYYYFDSKDQVFDLALERFFQGYCTEFQHIVDGIYRDPYRTMTRFFQYIARETRHFREQYAEKLNRAVRMAIREHTLTILVPYLQQIVAALVACGAKPPLSLETTALMLAHGAGSLFLHEDSDWVDAHWVEVQRSVNLMMGLSFEWADIMFPVWPESEADVQGIVELAERLEQHFPGFERAAFEARVREKLARREGLVICHHGVVVGCIGFVREAGEIDFLAVAPEYRKRGIATRLMVSAMSEFEPGAELSLCTYQDGDERAAEALKLYRSFGFRPAGQLTCFGTPCQRLVTTVPDCVPPLRSMYQTRMEGRTDGGEHNE